MKKVLITGGTGFLGRNVVNLLVKEKFETVCISRNNFDSHESNIRYVRGFLEDRESIRRYFEDVHVCIHLAAETVSMNEKINYMSNVVATKNVVELCKSNDIQKIIFTSSINTRFKNLGPYGKTKLLAENVVKASGLNYIVLVPDLIYGKGDRGLTKTINMIKKVPVIPIIGNGNSKMQPVYVEDVAAAIINATKMDLKSKTYYIGGPEAISFNDYINIIMEKFNLRKTKIHLPFTLFYYIAKIFSKTNKFPINVEQCIAIVNDKCGDISDASKDLNFKPITFLDGLDMLLGETK